MTEKLFYSNEYQMEFTAKVLECQAGKKGYEIILDRTAFYPEGGGQPWDTGILGDCRVTEVHEKKETIIHYTDAPLEVGATVTGTIDWQRRFDLMQQHSGEHIVSGVIHRKFGYDNVGFHMGADVVTIDFNGELTQEQMQEVELEVNRYIWENRACEVSFPTQEQLKVIPYRSKKELSGAVRIVTFPEGDICACCGLHVHCSGEIGMVKLLSVQKFRQGVRMEMICGKRVLDYMNMLQHQNTEISVLLSAKQEKVAESVQRLAEENFHLKGHIMKMEEKEFRAIAEQIKDAGNVLLFEEGLTSDSIRKLAVACMESCKGICAVFSPAEDGSMRYAIGQADGDLRAFVKQMNTELNGRGGGKPFFVQGSVKADQSKVQQYFECKTDAANSFYCKPLSM
ncbi:MAG: alanyl-tRNA editing protein [Clostridiales bacterium]|nr:alanyl-tRNA editing protein [Clostridiales bacterium]